MTMRDELRPCIKLLVASTDELSRLYVLTGNPHYIETYNRLCALIVDLKVLVKRGEDTI